MAQPGKASLALIVRDPPFAQRAARADLDVALAASAIDFRLEIFFLGEAVMQLALERDGQAAMLPAGYRAWAALPELAEARMYAETAWLECCERRMIPLLVPVEPLSTAAMSARWRRCQHVMMI